MEKKMECKIKKFHFLIFFLLFFCFNSKEDRDVNNKLFTYLLSYRFLIQNINLS